jgi:hypothetical protein
VIFAAVEQLEGRRLLSTSVITPIKNISNVPPSDNSTLIPGATPIQVVQETESVPADAVPVPFAVNPPVLQQTESLPTDAVPVPFSANPPGGILTTSKTNSSSISALNSVPDDDSGLVAGAMPIQVIQETESVPTSEVPVQFNAQLPPGIFGASTPTVAVAGEGLTHSFEPDGSSSPSSSDLTPSDITNFYDNSAASVN